MITLVATIAVALGGVPSPVPDSLCDRISEIKSLPMKGPGSDEVYRGFMESGEAAIPCLIEAIGDTATMPDPRGAPTYGGVVVGDVAFFILVDITGTDLDAMWPADVRAQYEKQGVYAYFEWVSAPAHRAELQQRWRAWWQQRSTSRRSEK